MECFLIHIPQEKWNLIEGVLKDNGFGEFKLATPSKEELELIEYSLDELRSRLEMGNCKVKLPLASEITKFYPFFKNEEGYWFFPLCIKQSGEQLCIIVSNLNDENSRKKYKEAVELLYATISVLRERLD